MFMFVITFHDVENFLSAYKDEQGANDFAAKENGPPPVGLPWDSLSPPSESVLADGGRMYGDVITKISRIDRLPKFLTHGAPLARFTRWSFAMTCRHNKELKK